MLIEFRVTNYRSFRDTQKFTMVSGPAPEHVETHTFDTGISDLRRLLRSAAVYGANAAGQTNLLRAIQVSTTSGRSRGPPIGRHPHENQKTKFAAGSPIRIYPDRHVRDPLPRVCGLTLCYPGR